MTAWRWCGIGIVVLVCGAGNCDEEDPLYDVASVEMIHEQVDVLNGSTFELEVRLRDSDSHTIPESFAYAPEWISSDNVRLRQLDASGHTARFEASLETSAATPVTIDVRVRVLGLEDVATIRILPQNYIASELIMTPHRALDPPEILLADGGRGTNCVHDERRAFVAAVLLADFGPCSDGTDPELIVYSIARELGFVTPVNWTAGADVVNLSTRAPPQTPIVNRPLVDPTIVKLRLWNAAAIPRAQIDAKVLYLKSVYAKNRVGITFDTESYNTLPALSANRATSCGTAGISETGAFNALAAAPPDKVVNAVFVAGMAYGDIGFTCPYPTTGLTEGGALFVDPTRGTNATFAHEMGHALSLLRANIGHVNVSSGYLAGFDSTNIMAGGGSDRRSLSLGQVFRMTADSTSWLNRLNIRSAPKRKCGEHSDGGPRPCPKLSLH
jgi:hypothetical protein